MSTRVFLVCPHCCYELRPEHPDNQGPTAWLRLVPDLRSSCGQNAFGNLQPALPQGIFQPAEHCGWIG